jgi:glycosyltransferase involved in cell wall biosynthesis
MTNALLLLAQITKKLRINEMAYHILRRIYSGDQTVCPPVNWKEYLSRLHPDVGGSCLCENEIVSKKDLVNLEIVIPVYNTEKYVAECIESALNQNTKYSYRVVIVNDGSTDSSSEVINRYASDSRVRIIQQENRGLSGARNRALEFIGGEYITFLDSDDRLPADAIEKMLNKAYEGDYDIVGGGYIRFNGKRFKSKTIPRQDQLYGFSWGKVYKATLWEEVKFPERYWFEDTVSAMIMHDCAKRIASIQEIVYEYRINYNGICAISEGNPKVIDSLWITLKLIKDRKRLGLPFGNKFTDQLVNQCKVNTQRIYTLGDKKANLANFLASKELYHHYCKNNSYLRTTSKPIVESFLKDDYYQFLLGCLFL